VTKSNDSTVLADLERMLLDAATRRAGDVADAATDHDTVGPWADASPGGAHASRLRSGAARIVDGARRRRVRRRGSLIAVVVALTTGTALAATRPWQPLLGNDRQGHPTTSVQPVDADVLGLLAVLRRAQTDADRGPDVQSALRAIGDQNHGVRVASVRRVGETPAGQPVVLVPVERFGDDAAGPSATSVGNALCLYYPVTPAAGQPAATGYPCWTTPQLASGDAVGHAQGADGQHIFGLVPNGVHTVTVWLTGGTQVTATVANNYFAATAPDSAPRFAGIESVAWKDANQRPVGPPVPTTPRVESTRSNR
jgi:hypothetical protein